METERSDDAIESNFEFDSERSENVKSVENALEVEKDTGRISLAFIDGDPNENSEYPLTYYSFSAKERLLLIFTENFRRQFIHDFPNRKPIVLAIPNECEIQKFVSTTIRPSVFLYPELIDDWQGIAQFVADFIIYEPLDDPIQLVSYTLEMQDK